MNPNPEPMPDPGALRLTGTLDIYGAEKLRETLLARFGDTNEIVVDLEAVVACDTTGLQLLLAARRKANEGGRVLRFSRVPAAVQTCGQRLGLPADL